MPKAIIIEPDCTMRVVQLNGLDDYQQAVGGYFEQIVLHRATGSDAVMLVNEEGFLRGLSHNRIASSLATMFTLQTETIVGNVAIVGNGDEDYTDIPDDLFQFILTSPAADLV